MKRFAINVRLEVLLHAFVAWIHRSYPEPDSGSTIRLWQQEYVEAGLLDWHLPTVAQKTFFLWFPFWASSDLGAGHLPLGVRLCVSSAAWFAFVLGVQPELTEALIQIDFSEFGQLLNNSPFTT